MLHSKQKNRFSFGSTKYLAKCRFFLNFLCCRKSEHELQHIFFCNDAIPKHFLLISTHRFCFYFRFHEKYLLDCIVSVCWTLFLLLLHILHSRMLLCRLKFWVCIYFLHLYCFKSLLLATSKCDVHFKRSSFFRLCFTLRLLPTLNWISSIKLVSLFTLLLEKKLVHLD